MDESIQFLLRHGYTVLFIWVLAEQIGLPVPSIPFLLAVGALAGAGRLSLPLAVLTAVAACLLADLLWYEAGRRRGQAVLNLLCRVSLEPDSCVRKTENVFARHGVRSLLYAKFVPGLSTAAPPLAGMFGPRRPHFVFYDGLGALLWVLAYAGPGYLFSDQLERLALYASRLGTSLVIIVVGGFAAYVLWKYVERHRFLRALRIARITPEALLAQLEAGEDVVVVDLRHRMEFEAAGEKVRGALHFDPEEFETRHGDIPRDRDVVLYCA